MKYISLLLISAFLTCCITTVTAQSKNKSDKAKKNLETCNAINKAIEAGDINKLDMLIAKDGIDHAGMHGDVVGLDSIKAELGQIHAMAPDMKSEILKEVADDEYVFQWMRYTGTTATTDMGMPVGTKFDMNSVHVSKFRDGKAVEHWEFMQPADMMKMMAPNGGMNAGQKQDSSMQK